MSSGMYLKTLMNLQKGFRGTTNGGFLLSRFLQMAYQITQGNTFSITFVQNGRSTLGDLIYKGITVDFFDPDQFLCTMDLSSEHKVLDLKNKIEASIIIWKRKMNNKDGKANWGSAVSMEKRELFEERAETILLLLKQRFPGLPQSSLDISKIEYNKDVGFSVLESYSRVLESLANTVMNRVDDVLYADSLTQDPSLAVSTWKRQSPDTSPLRSADSFTGDQDGDKLSSSGTPQSMTLSDFMDWKTEQAEPDKKQFPSAGSLEYCPKEDNAKSISKMSNIIPKRYIDKITNGKRSPRARH